MLQGRYKTLGGRYKALQDVRGMLQEKPCVKICLHDYHSKDDKVMVMVNSTMNQVGDFYIGDVIA